MAMENFTMEKLAMKKMNMYVNGKFGHRKLANCWRNNIVLFVNVIVLRQCSVYIALFPQTEDLKIWKIYLSRGVSEREGLIDIIRYLL